MSASLMPGPSKRRTRQKAPGRATSPDVRAELHAPRAAACPLIETVPPTPAVCLAAALNLNPYMPGVDVFGESRPRC
jgi:hypothetical protein